MFLTICSISSILFITTFFLMFDNIYGLSFSDIPLSRDSFDLYNSQIGVNLEVPSSWYKNDTDESLEITSNKDGAFDPLLETFDILKVPSYKSLGLTAKDYIDFLTNYYLNKHLNDFQVKAKGTVKVSGIESPYVIYEYRDDRFASKSLAYEIIVPAEATFYDIIMTTADSSYFEYLEKYFKHMLKSLEIETEIDYTGGLDINKEESQDYSGGLDINKESAGLKGLTETIGEGLQDLGK
jgi:hypothetical protein